MDGMDAARVFVEQGQSGFTVEPIPIQNRHGYAVYRLINGQKVSGVIEKIGIDPQDGT